MPYLSYRPGSQTPKIKTITSVLFFKIKYKIMFEYVDMLFGCSYRSTPGSIKKLMVSYTNCE